MRNELVSEQRCSHQGNETGLFWMTSVKGFDFDRNFKAFKSLGKGRGVCIKHGRSIRWRFGS